MTTASPDDFKNPDNQKFVVDALVETGDYHKLVFGEILDVWLRK